MNGLLNLNKPAGMTSRGVVDAVVALARTRKVGHAGTLDPLATGVLVVCIGDATRLVPQVQNQHKEYRAEFLLGHTSDTDDISGEVVVHEVAAPPTRSDIELLLPQFTGPILQVPPQFSAVHVDGQRAHHLARRGAAVTLPPRPVEVEQLVVIAFEYPHLELNIVCGSGTYVRALGRDLGERLGCGALMRRLVRRRIGSFELASAVPLDALTRQSLASHLLPLSAAVAPLSRRVCTEVELIRVFTGRPVPLAPIASAYSTSRSAPHLVNNAIPDDLPTPASWVALLTPQNELAALARYAPETGLLHPKQVFGGPPG